MRTMIRQTVFDKFDGHCAYCGSEYLVVLCDYSEYSKPVFIEACYFSSTKSWLSYEGKGSITKVYRWWPKQNFDRNYAQSGGEQ